MQKFVSLIRSHLFIFVFIFITLNCCWVTQSCLTLCDSMACSMPGFPVLHCLPEFTQTHVQMPSSVTHFCPQSFPGSGSFSVLFFRLFASGGQSIGALASVLPMNIQDWFPLGLTDLISLQSKGLSRVFSSTTIWKHQIFGIQPSLWSNYQISTWLLEKPVLTIGTYVGKIMSLLFNMLSRLIKAFLSRSKHLLISQLHHLQWFLSPRK